MAGLLDYGAFGTGSPAETAQQPSGLAALLGGAYNAMGLLAKRALGNSANAVGTGTYDAGPPLEAALTAMTGGFAGTGPGGVALGSGPIAKTVWSDLAKTKHPIAVEDMTATRVPTGELLPRKVITPEDLQGSVLMPAVGDRTAAGSTLTHINEKPLSFPVSLEGGPDFMRAAASQADGSAWASDKGVITRLAKHARELGQNNDVNFVYSSMGARSGDYSHMMSDALLAQLEGAKITKKAAKEFDAAMKAQDASWPGLYDPGVRDALLKSGPMRKTFVEEMALGQHQNAGFPEIGSTRFAISEPSMIGQPTGASGYAVAKMDPSGRVISNPSVPHTTYNTQLGGLGYLGGFDKSVPREILFPDFYATRRAAGAPMKADDRAFSMSNVSQNANQQWLDGMMKYLQGR
jgi:hypothetical protein